MINKNQSLSAFFHEEVGKTLDGSKVDVTPATIIYIVDMLVGFSNPPSETTKTMTTPLIFCLDEARRSTGAEKARKLRAIGDSVLYVSGFFPEHVYGRVDRKYAVAIGSVAYDGVAETLRMSARQASTFSELSSKFSFFISILSGIAERANARQAHGESGLLSLYGRWVKTGSKAAAEELEARGIPTRFGRGSG